MIDRKLRKGDRIIIAAAALDSSVDKPAVVLDAHALRSDNIACVQFEDGTTDYIIHTFAREGTHNPHLSFA